MQVNGAVDSRGGLAQRDHRDHQRQVEPRPIGVLGTEALSRRLRDPDRAEVDTTIIPEGFDAVDLSSELSQTLEFRTIAPDLLLIL